MTTAELVDRSARLLRMARLVISVAVAVGLVLSGCGNSAMTRSPTTTVAPAVTLPAVPPRDRFVGMLSNGTRSLAGARDVVEARLQAPGTAGTRPLTLWIVSTGCRAASGCVHLSGSLRGRLVPVRSLPDIGRRYAITATGSLSPVGAIRATGTVAGTGNIAFGSESLQLILTGRRGSARLTARSGRVPAFTAP